MCVPALQWQGASHVSVAPCRDAALSRDDCSHIGRSPTPGQPTRFETHVLRAGIRLANLSIAVVPGVDETSADFLPAHGALFTDWRSCGPLQGPSYDARNAALSCSRSVNRRDRQRSQIVRRSLRSDLTRVTANAARGAGSPRVRKPRGALQSSSLRRSARA